MGIRKFMEDEFASGADTTIFLFPHIIQDVAAENFCCLTGTNTIFVSINSAYYFGNDMLRLSKPGNRHFVVGHAGDNNTTTAHWPGAWQPLSDL